MIAEAVLAAAILTGGHTSNGGKVVVCHDEAGAVRSIELFDYHEGRLLRHLQPDLSAATTVEGKVELALSRWDGVDPLRAARYRDWAKRFMDEAELLTRSLPDIPDSEPLMDPPVGCAYEQMAIQREPQFPGDKRYFLDRNLFDSPRLGADDKAGLILHEIIYRDAIGFGAENSIGARYLNSLVAADQLGTFDFAGYVDILMRADILSVSFKGLWLDLRKERPIYHDHGTLAYAQLAEGNTIATPWGPVSARCSINFTVDGEVQGFNLGNLEEFPIELGGYKIFAYPRRGRDEPCGAIGGAPGFDIFLKGGVTDKYVSVNAIFDRWLSGDGFVLQLGGTTIFRDGKLEMSTVVDDDEGDGNVFVEVNGAKCTPAAGAVGFVAGVPGQLGVRKCLTRLPQAQLQIQGRVALRQKELTAAFLPAMHQRLPTPQNPSFVAAGTAGEHGGRFDLELWPNGVPRMALVGGDQELVRATGEAEFVMDGSYAQFDERGALIGVIPP